jgi:putative chitinase
MILNKPKTYENIRKNFGVLSQSQVEGFEAIFDEWRKQSLTDLRWLAYILATVWHETNKTMQPIEEYEKGKGKRYGNREWFDGKLYVDIKTIFYGRGHTQNTWRDIYKKLTFFAKQKGFDWDFVNKPQLLLEMKPSIWATFFAMQSGLYTGKKLSNYFSKTANDPVEARRIINGKDKAHLIAEYYHKFLACIE